MKKFWIMIFYPILFSGCLSETVNEKTHFTQVLLVDRLVPIISYPDISWFSENIYYGMPVSDLSSKALEIVSNKNILDNNNALEIANGQHMLFLHKNKWMICIIIDSNLCVSNLRYLNVESNICYESVLHTKVEVLSSKIIEDMKEQEVRSIMGEPDSIENLSNNGEEHNYFLIYKSKTAEQMEVTVKIEISKSTMRVVGKTGSWAVDM